MGAKGKSPWADPNLSDAIDAHNRQRQEAEAAAIADMQTLLDETLDKLSKLFPEINDANIGQFAICNIARAAGRRMFGRNAPDALISAFLMTVQTDALASSLLATTNLKGPEIAIATACKQLRTIVERKRR